MTNAINALVLAAGNAVGSLVDNSSSYEELFPILQQGSGTPRFDGRKNPDVEDIDGKDTITGYYMAHRFNFVAYPGLLKTDSEGKVIGEPDKPCYGGTAPMSGPDAQLVKNAAQAVQFTRATDRAKFAFESSNAGIVRVSVEILTFVPKINRVVVLRSYNHYNGIFKPGKTLDKLDGLKGEDGCIKQTPIKFIGATDPGYGGKALQWIDAEYDASSVKKCQDALDAFLTQQYQDLLPDLNKWAKCEDNPITDTVRGYLNNVVALNPPRR